MHRLAPVTFALFLSFAGVAAADPAPIVYVGPTRADNGLVGGDERSYGYGGDQNVNAPIDLRTPSAPVSGVGQPQTEQGAQPWLERERVGPPYQVAGRTYVPTPEPGYAQTGHASWYGPNFHGRRTANGEVFDQEALTAAHPTLPLNSLVQVTNLENGREIIVRVNDRGPFVGSRLIDLSRGAATVLGFERAGGAQVHVRYLGPAPRRVSPQNAALAPETLTAAPVAQPNSAPASLVPAPGSEAPPPGALYVQVGAFADFDNAQRVRVAAGAAGPVSVDVRNSASGGEVYRVRVGPFATREEAATAQTALSGLGYYDAALVAR